MNTEPRQVNKTLSKTRIMQNQPVDLNTNPHGFWMSRVGLPALGSLLILLMACLALNRLVPKVSGRASGAPARLGWYLRSGQLSADFRTLAAAFQFVLDLEPSAPAEIGTPAIQPAAIAPETGPKPSGMMRAIEARG
jgi:hypothetical protein